MLPPDHLAIFDKFRTILLPPVFLIHPLTMEAGENWFLAKKRKSDFL